MEKDTCSISSDLLISMAKHFNVTTDYILGLSDIKRDLSGQIRMNQEMDQCYDIILRYQSLTDTAVSSQTSGTGSDRGIGIIYSNKRGVKMLRIAICDDDFAFTGSLETLVLHESKCIGIRVETDVFSDGKTLLESIQSGERYGLIFIDIEMEPIDGIYAARKIRETDRSVLWIISKISFKKLTSYHEICMPQNEMDA